MEQRKMQIVGKIEYSVMGCRAHVVYTKDDGTTETIIGEWESEALARKRLKDVQAGLETVTQAMPGALLNVATKDAPTLTFAGFVQTFYATVIEPLEPISDSQRTEMLHCFAAGFFGAMHFMDGVSNALTEDEAARCIEMAMQAANKTGLTETISAQSARDGQL